MTAEREALRAVRDAAQAFARQHVAALAANLNEWQDTALLPSQCKLRELAEICHRMDPQNDLALAEGFANRACREAVAPPEQPAAQAEPAPYDGYLCRAWGETELPCAEVVRDLAGVRRFIVREWIGDGNDPDLTGIMAEVEVDIEREKAWFAQFEIGGASVEPVYSYATPPAPTEQPRDETLHTFLNAAAGEGLVLDGIDAADLYIALFPERFAARAAQDKGGA